MAQAFETAHRGRRNGAVRTALRARTSDVLGDFAALRKDMSKLAQAATKAARTEVRTAGHRLEQLGHDIRARAGEGAGYVSEQVRAHPGVAIGASLGVGLLIGLLLSARR
jgi:ElaB/YqjD/DUF883 family membrane-anchored ribosome-binding protein